MNTRRDASLDVLRGLAIALMAFGHLAAEIIVLPSGIFYIEALGGLAPALFVAISGVVVAESVWRRGRELRRSLLRAGQLLVVAAALDVAFWRIRPFTSVDVLYLIAVSLPVAHGVATRVPPAGRWALAALFLLAAPPLRIWLGYCDYPTEYALDGTLVTEIEVPGEGVVALGNQTSIAHHWIVDGWFPLFPWLGFSLLGVAAARLRWRPEGIRPFDLRTGLLPGALLILAGLLLGWLEVDHHVTPRLLYAGAFNPPGYGFLLGSVGTIAVALFVVDRRPSLPPWRLLDLIGRHSLLIYVLHFPAIRLLAWALGERVSHPVYLALYAAMLGALALVAAGADAVAARRRDRAGPTLDAATRSAAPPPGPATPRDAQERRRQPPPSRG